MQGGQPVACASRAMTDTETRHAQIEKEMLAIVFSLEKFHQYTFGRHTNVESDHKPLEAILDKPLSAAPRRLQGMMLRIQDYDITVKYKKGKEMYVADTLSRAYVTTSQNMQEEFEHVNMVSFLPHFGRYGCPCIVVSDNGLQFISSSFVNYSKEWDFEHRTTSPYNSKANGKAESAVKTVKSLLRKNREQYQFLAPFNYRNTPSQVTGTCPVQNCLTPRRSTQNYTTEMPKTFTSTRRR